MLSEYASKVVSACCTPYYTNIYFIIDTYGCRIGCLEFCLNMLPKSSIACQKNPLALNLHVNNHSCQNPNGIKFLDKLL